MGRWFGEKLNACEGPVRFLIPEGGVSALNAPGLPFHDPAADRALFDAYLDQVAALGFSGVQNFPTVGIIDGAFRANLEETGMGYALEVEMIRPARAKELLTTPYMFNPDEAVAMAEAGADMLVAHMGLTSGGAIGAGTARSTTVPRVSTPSLRLGSGYART